MLLHMLLLTGQEYPAVVEFAPFQKTSKKRSKKRDTKCGTIDEGKDISAIVYFIVKNTDFEMC